MPVKSTKPFPQTARTLLDRNDISRRELARRMAVHGRKWNQSSVARLIAGESNVLPVHMEAIAKALLIQPEVFAEYRLWKARSEYDPAVVGWERAVKNLERWEGAVGLADPPVEPAEVDEPDEERESSPPGRAASA